MKRLSTAGVALVLVLASFPVWAATVSPGVSADAALTKLKEGNARFAAGTLRHPNQDVARRQDIGANGQHPFAVVLACADSRVPPEVIFDQGLGDLFVVRVAGNVAATDEIGSIEYAADHLGTALVVVLGHTKCGAVTAVVKKEPTTASIGKLVSPIAPAVARVEKQFPTASQEEIIRRSVEANVWQAIADTYKTSFLLKRLAAQGKVNIVGAIYDVDSGQVRFLGEHPHKATLLQ